MNHTKKIKWVVGSCIALVGICSAVILYRTLRPERGLPYERISMEQAAEYIAEVTGGDLFELEPAEPYTDEDLNWTDENSRVSQEYADESLRDVELVSTTVENWDSYDTVYIGYPIWWGIAAWPVNGFVSANDFTGKTVIPFATSSSSGMGESGELLAELAGTGDWQEGQRFSSGVSETDVTEWVNNLGITE